MKRLLITALSACSIIAATAQQTFTFGTATNPDGHTIMVDRYGLIIDGHHTIPVMGEIHYSRVPADEWRREIRKMKAGGITVASTYVFWIHHEAEEGKWDWSGNLNLRQFVQTCKEENMPVVLRVGPFCHGEVYQGGFPTWLVDKAQADPKQYKLRSEAPGFIAATHSLLSNIYSQVDDLLWKSGGPVIGMQIENECRGPWSYYMRLKHMATDIGFDLPFYTRTGWPKRNGGEKDFGQMLPLYGDYADGFWDRVLTDMPGEYTKAFVMKDTRLSSVIATEALGTGQSTKMESTDLDYPYLTCELGGGMMPSYHRRINISGREIQPLAICKLGSGSNLPGYYMYHGGTNPYNPLHTMAECQASPVTNYNDMPHMSYDFQAPLGEMGQLNPTAYHQSRWLHQMLADWGEELSTYAVDTLSEQYARRGPFIFRNDYVRIKAEGGSASVTLDGWQYEGLTISTEGLQPFAKCHSGKRHTIYFITTEGNRHALHVGSKTYDIQPGKSKTIKGIEFAVLSPEAARKAYVIDHTIRYAQHDGILYKTPQGQYLEEAWLPLDIAVPVTQTAETSGLREVKMGSQKVAEQPSEDDFSRAATWQIDITSLVTAIEAESKAKGVDISTDDLFVNISYRGDVARIYADGQLVQDNFWNGKSMYVRLSSLLGKQNVHLRILPLGKSYPIYLQTAQRTVLDAAPGEYLLSLDDIRVIWRKTIETSETETCVCH